MNCSNLRFVQQAHEMKRDLITFIISLCVMLVCGFAVMQSNLKEISIEDNGELKTYQTYQQTVDAFLKEVKIRVGNFDEMSVAFEDRLEDDMTIEITRAQPVVINDGGVKTRIMTTEARVDEVLDQESIELNNDDEMSVSAMSMVQTDMEIEITRVKKEYDSVIEEVDLKVEYVYTEDLPKDTQKVTVEGSPKKIERFFETTFENGEEVSKKEVETKVVDAGVAKEVTIGTAPIKTEVAVVTPKPTPTTPTTPNTTTKPSTTTTPTPTPAPTTKPSEDSVTTTGPISTFVANMTAYTANCEGCTGRVACKPYPDVSSSIYYSDSQYGSVRIVAAGQGYPCGTIVEISGVGKAIVLDRGGAITGEHLDLLVNTNPWDFGRKYLQTKVLRMGW